MGIFKKDDVKVIDRYMPDVETKISKKLDINVKNIKAIFSDCDDIVFREFQIGGIDGTNSFICYVDGLVDKNLIHEFVITPLMITVREVEPDYKEIVKCLAETSKNSGMAISDVKEQDIVEKSASSVLSGECILLIDGYDKAFIIATRMWPVRGIAEPTTETVVRGSKDGFTETMRMNTALVRRRIRDPRFKVKQKQVGVRSKTDIAIMYIDDIVDKEILTELYLRMEKIKIDAILDSGYIEQFVEDNSFSPFPQIQTTERPDAVAAALYEGRVALIVDNSPIALIVPTTLAAFFQSPEDYYTRSVLSTFIRCIRLIAGTVSVLAPALYIAITSFNPGIIPTRLALNIAATREGVPFPAFIEAIIMELTFELLREAGVRLPRAIGSTIGIVGGLVIGQSAVTANIVSPIMVIVVAITAIASFAIPNYEVSAAFRLIRFTLMIAAAIYGLYGIVLVAIAVLIHLSNIKSYNIPYLSPVTPLSTSDMKDLLYRTPWKYIVNRPLHYGSKNRRRQGK